MECPVCLGKGYKEVTATIGGEIVVIWEWCKKCKGTGWVEYEGDRNNIDWEGE